MAKRTNRPVPSIWATGQVKPHRQRSDSYVAGNAHPAKMWPHIAATAIARYSKPGETVLDPMCGVGTSLIEAIQLGRNAYGVDLEPEWVAMARANVAAALAAHSGPRGEVVQGDAADLVPLLERARLRGTVDLVLTSPPYGAVTHGQPDTSRITGGKIRNRAHRYSEGKPRPESLATSSASRLREGLEAVFSGCLLALRPGGVAVVTARPFTDAGKLVDFPSFVVRAGVAAGFDLAERRVALLSRWDGVRLSPSVTFFHLHNVRRARAAGRSVFARAHEDVLVFRKPR
ncbi:DNA methyltransferase [Glycomyces sp. NPDC046736]|uniref:TRM11 family SAM-dependent methyltransferase n=1 Tax=Glycomyces sp. NPDC046736 TaxID=3155615 RepID=UPI0033E969A7